MDNLNTHTLWMPSISKVLWHSMFYIASIYIIQCMLDYYDHSHCILRSSSCLLSTMKRNFITFVPDIASSHKCVPAVKLNDSKLRFRVTNHIFYHINLQPAVLPRLCLSVKHRTAFEGPMKWCYVLLLHAWNLTTQTDFFYLLVFKQKK